ncbi:hypothetical protein RDWZM_001923 [Blomia tropicalis]|uniref:Fatty acid desaturase domain-containing protein n=1 Tax=Blomia tropicalis TaxID=40697 RepID=A0A9Q0ME00_BLOTA|nr:hypothetical protein RDWZM_001923 [Blomia tropicalis]
MGITAGAHRLWSHRSYKATLPLRILLMLLNSMALQNDIYVWCRDHRMHHKFSETDADPHNSKRGFFFAHMGWLLCKKHPEVIEKGKSLNFNDLLDDPVVRFQRRFYIPLVLLFCFIVPTIVPVYLCGETVNNAFFTCAFLRYCYILHCTWFVNSAAHMFGQQQYDKSIEPRENSFVRYCSYGEGYHNYHHVFPYDYSASELDWRDNFNFSTLFIDSFAMIGWAHDRRKVAPSNIMKRIERTGDVQLYRELSHKRDNPIKSIMFATSHFWFPFIVRMYTMGYFYKVKLIL